MTCGYKCSKMSCSKALLFTLLLSCLLLNAQVGGKEYMRCQLARELLEKYGINKTFLSNWICLIEHESNRNTKVVKRNPNGSASYGLFQISSKDWCRVSRKGGICDMKCEDFIDDNIADDVACAKTIFERVGFKNWPGWQTSCRNTQNLPNLGVACNIQTVRPSRTLRFEHKSNYYNIFQISNRYSR
ncbi:PREDICTED: lysozyme-like isoform X3 [Rhagoletis zephyria]|uniref:lysozyme-like isoform X3 n=1 Tax=Rhagoletis zephyria TaxID=28612 RepID=UPI00081129E4|nr:PREDICTED: lysozyme-like isoform X3 [Rhagoletis zephyria]